MSCQTTAQGECFKKHKATQYLCIAKIEGQREGQHRGKKDNPCIEMLS